MRIFEFETFSDFYNNHSQLISLNDLPSSNKGYSYTANSIVDFIVKTNKNGKINHRETYICPETKLNNRLRSCAHFYDLRCNAFANDKIYITEQVTPFYKYFKKKYPYLIGSEFLNDSIDFGSKNDAGILNQDLTNLTFADNSFDKVISFECLEHIFDYKKSLSEIFRVLKRNGQFLLTVPFLAFSKLNVMRAQVEQNGKIVHLLEPEYHGNPTLGKDDGSLCFYHFGWEFLDVLKEIGFKSATANFIRSEYFMYPGNILNQVIIKASK